MTTEQITKIIAGAEAYMAAKGMSQAELAKYVDVNDSYISVMMRGGTKVGDTEIAPKYWRKLAQATTTDDGQVWQLIPTVQYKRMRTELMLAKEQQMSRVLIGDPGSGKTMSIQYFKSEYPRHTYVVTINSLVSVNDIILLLMRQMDLPVSRTPAMRLYDIIIKLREIRIKGGFPIIIFDEGENMEHRLMKMLKGLYDGLEKYCSLVLVGTEQLVGKIVAAKVKNKEAGPQFYRRFYPGIRRLAAMDRKFTVFYEHYQLPYALRQLLNGLCENYGELNKYMEPVLIEARERGVAVTEQLFREYHDIM